MSSLKVFASSEILFWCFLTRKTNASRSARCRGKYKQCAQNETNGNDVVRGFRMGNGEMYRKTKIEKEFVL